MVYCTYLVYYMNVIYTWCCSIHFTLFATCQLHTYLICCMYVLCTACGIHALAPRVTVVCACVWGVCVHLLASDSSAQASRVQVAIQTLDENDNAPQLAEPYDTFVCDSAAPGQVSH